MSDIPSFPYRLLWEERSVASVANLTRADGEEFLALAPRAKVRTTTTPYPLEQSQPGARRLARGAPRGRGGARAVRGLAVGSPCCAASMIAESVAFVLEVEAFSFPFSI